MNNLSGMTNLCLFSVFILVLFIFYTPTYDYCTVAITDAEMVETLTVFIPSIRDFVDDGVSSRLSAEHLVCLSHYFTDCKESSIGNYYGIKAVQRDSVLYITNKDIRVRV